MARAVLRSEVDAEDVVQETWVRAYANLRQLANPERFAAWIGRIALYEAFARVRQNQRQVAGGDEAAARRGSSSSDPERATSEQEIVRLVEDAIDSLPEKYRITLVLRGVEGLTAAETARQLNVSRVTVNTRFHRARALLRAALSERLGVLPRVFDFLGSRCRRLRESVMERVGAMPSVEM